MTQQVGWPMALRVQGSKVIKRYAPLDKPADLAKDIEAALAD